MVPPVFGCVWSLYRKLDGESITIGLLFSLNLAPGLCRTRSKGPLMASSPPPRRPSSPFEAEERRHWAATSMPTNAAAGHRAPRRRSPASVEALPFRAPRRVVRCVLSSAVDVNRPKTPSDSWKLRLPMLLTAEKTWVQRWSRKGKTSRFKKA